MDEKEKLKLEITYSEMPDSELIEMLLVDRSEYDKEDYDLVSAEVQRRGLETKIDKIKDKDRNNHRFWTTCGWLLCWRIQKGKLERQVEEYNTLWY